MIFKRKLIQDFVYKFKLQKKIGKCKKSKSRKKDREEEVKKGVSKRIWLLRRKIKGFSSNWLG